MKTVKELLWLGEAKKKMKDSDPCWDNYEMVGTKKKNGKEVPNCVPKNEEVVAEEVEQVDELNKDTLHSYAKKSEKDQDDQFNKIGKGIRDNDPKSANKAGHKFSMRSIGQNRAEKRLNNEEVEQKKLTLPPHLLKLIKDKLLDKKPMTHSSKVKDVTPKGYGPNEEVVAEGSSDDDEYGPKAREEWLKQQAFEKKYNKKKPSTPVKPVNKNKERGVAEGLEPKKRARLDDLVGMYRDSTDPSDYYDSEYEDPEEVLSMIRAEFGNRVADQVEAGTDKMHFPRKDHDQGYDPMSWRKPVDRQTKAGKMYKQDSDYRKNTIKARYRNSGKSATKGVAEDINVAFTEAVKKDEVTSEKDIKKGEKLSGKQEPIKINPPLPQK